jgi:glucose-6-phosphate dehydrogenase assembly protein OpcA
MAATLSPDRILKELSDLWVSLGKPGETEARAGVLRACSLTLVVLAEEAEDVGELGETIAALMPEHPARTIIIRLRGEGERTLSERVYAQCWMPFGQRRQICCEQVEITASDAALADLPPVVLPLAVPDLPLMVWCRSARLFGMPEFRRIAAMAAKVVIDSSTMTDPSDALRRLSDVSGHGVMIGDLAWTRITRWRAMLSQVFENRQTLALIPGISRVHVAFAPGYDTAAWYMGAWISDCLGGRELTVEADAGVSSLRVELTGENLRVELMRQEGRLIVAVNEIRNCTSLSPPTDYLLMREELAIVRRDQVFERTLASAARLAYSGNQ